MGHPARLGPLLRDLHDADLLERFIPEFRHARGLLQFNQYHKYTVDEHCLRAVEFATELWSDPGPLGRVYRPLAQKHLLHLALLLHDLGKGYLEDHREVGVKIAADAARRLGLPAHEAEALRFLVHKHMLMNHLAFRRDTADEQLAVQFAVQVGSPELLQMLYVLTAADLGAVGPGRVGRLEDWKSSPISTTARCSTLRAKAPKRRSTNCSNSAARRFESRLGPGKDDAWFAEHLDALPSAYLNATPPQQAAADLRLLRSLSPLLPGEGQGARASTVMAQQMGSGSADRPHLSRLSEGETTSADTPKVRPQPPGDVAVAAQYQPETATVQFTIATSEADHRRAFSTSSPGP